MIMREELKLSPWILNTSSWLLLWGRGFHCSDVWRAGGSCKGSHGSVFVTMNHWFHTVGFVGCSFHSLTVHVLGNRDSVTRCSSPSLKCPCESFLEVKQDDSRTRFLAFCAFQEFLCFFYFAVCLQSQMFAIAGHVPYLFSYLFSNRKKKVRETLQIRKSWKPLFLFADGYVVYDAGCVFPGTSALGGGGALSTEALRMRGFC